ncbi:cation:proton antiporter [Planctomicrobium sp. SH527]|uniref:cation:proton antiporter n=1 Tax=Planctomicrobium sp. SH527 TaxID=3448123 RepID=UPI003F5C2488
MEKHSILIALASLIVFGTGAQWLAWKLRLPSILLLLGCGFLAGPVLGIVEPDKMFGDLLFPFISLCVAVILFEGSLSLYYSELKEMGAVLLWFLTGGMLVTWCLSTLGAHYILNMQWLPSTLLGAILVVTGPTVIGPILRQIRPIGPVGPIARWEGIVIDPVGAILAVLVYDAYSSSVSAGSNASYLVVAQGLIVSLVAGISCGVAAATIVVRLIRSHSLPDHLESLVTLLFVVLSFTVSNLIHRESGLIAVTLMGVLMANSGVSLKHVGEFKESLSLLLISGLFILLAARVQPESFTVLGWNGIAFIAFMILVVRPLCVLVSTWTSNLNWKEKVFLAWLAPRGIVAAAVASIFAIELGPEDGAGLVPAIFLVIVGTVVVYGLTAYPLALRLGLASRDPQGLLIVGAHQGAQAIALAVQEAGFPVLLVDTNHRNIREAKMAGLQTEELNILQDEASEGMDLGGIGRLLAMTSNDEVNTLASMNFAELFGRANVFQLTPWRQAEKNESSALHLRSRYLFTAGLTFERLLERIESGEEVKMTKLSKEYDFAKFKETTDGKATVLFLVAGNRLTILDAEGRVEAKSGDMVIFLSGPNGG